MKRFAMLLAFCLLSISRIAAAQSLAGEWEATMSTPGGARVSKVLFKQEGEKLTGVVKREAGDVPLQGTIKGKTVEFSYTVDYNGNALTLSIAATVDGNTLKGTVSFGGQAEDEWSAIRVVKSPAESFNPRSLQLPAANANASHAS